MKKTKCDNCNKYSHPHSFICEHCGFDFDFQITYNKWGLPNLTQKIK